MCFNLSQGEKGEPGVTIAADGSLMTGMRGPRGPKGIKVLEQMSRLVEGGLTAVSAAGVCRCLLCTPLCAG